MITNKQIEGAYVNTFDEQKVRPKVIFANNSDELKSSMGSYYSQSTVAKSVLQNNIENCAAVVLGCQAESIKLSCEKLGFKRPKYLIGLVCAGQNSGLNTNYLINKSKIGSDALVSDFRFKSKQIGGWPGNVKIQSNKGAFSVSKDIRLLSKDIFNCYRCKLCFDKANVYSDIVCGDPWGLSKHEVPQGKTIILIRTQVGKELIEKAQAAGVISVEPLDIEKFFESIKLDSAVVERTLNTYKYLTDREKAIPYSVADKMLADRDELDKTEANKLIESKTFYSLDKSNVTSFIKRKDKQIKVKLITLKIKRIKNRLLYLFKRLIKVFLRK